MTTANPNVVLVEARPTSGKTYSLINIHEYGKTLHINCDKKQLPFKNEHPDLLVTCTPETPFDVLGYMEQAEASDTVEVVVLDTLTYAADMFVKQVIDVAPDTRAAWGDYSKYLMKIIEFAKDSKKHYIIMVHEEAVLNEASGVIERKAPLQGRLGKLGVEGHFTTILGAVKIDPEDIPEKQHNELLNFTEDSLEDGIHYAFQTRIDKKSNGAMYRAATGLFDRNEMYIDNDLVLVLRRLDAFYAT